MAEFCSARSNTISPPQWTSLSPPFTVTGREALEALKRDDFDLILMDIQMPKMDGKTATSKIRKIPGPKSETPIIACTADTSEQHIAEYKKLGMNGLLKKPIDNIELSHILIDFLNGELSFPPETSINLRPQVAVNNNMKRHTEALNSLLEKLGG